MKVCHKEAMKLIKELENKKTYVLRNENKLNSVRYRDGEARPETGYDYAATRAEVKKIDEQIRHIKHELAKANCKVLVDDFKITLGEALIYLAQLNNEQSRLESLSDEKQSDTSITPNGIVIHEDCLYDVEVAARDAEKLTAEINKLQVAIDRANLVNFIEI